MTNKIVRIFLILFCLSSSYLYAQEVNKDYLDGQLYVKIKDHVIINFDTTTNYVDYQRKLPFLNPLAKKYELQKVEAGFYFSKSDKLKRTFRLTFNKHSEVEEFIKALSLIPDVEYAEKIPLLKTTLSPNDLSINLGCFGLQYYLHDIDAPEAWDLTTGATNVWIAIVDNAIDMYHEDLSAQVVAPRDVADNDNNTSPPSAAYDHGTHCAGIACARNNNNKGYASIGYNCSLMPIKATSNSNSSPNQVTHGYEGITWAATYGANVISCSWGGQGYSVTEQNVVNYATLLNALVVAAAGNDNTSTPSYPAAYDNVLAVASLDCDDEKSSFSNYGTWVDICAYGRDIYSTLPNNNYGKKNGTSMACPMVAGLCGLIRTKFPSYNPEEVTIKLKQTAYNIYPYNPNHINQLGAGRIDAFNAVKRPCLFSQNISVPNPYTVLHTETNGTITISVPVSGVVKLDAASSITLLPGFHAPPGTKFNAYLDGCGGN